MNRFHKVHSYNQLLALRFTKPHVLVNFSIQNKFLRNTYFDESVKNKCTFNVNVPTVKQLGQINDDVHQFYLKKYFLQNMGHITNKCLKMEKTVRWNLIFCGKRKRSGFCMFSKVIAGNFTCLNTSRITNI